MDQAISLYSTRLMHGLSIDIDEYFDRQVNKDSPYFEYDVLLEPSGDQIPGTSHSKSVTGTSGPSPGKSLRRLTNTGSVMTKAANGRGWRCFVRFEKVSLAKATDFRGILWPT